MHYFDLSELLVTDPFGDIIFTAHIQQTTVSSLEVTITSYITDPDIGDSGDSFTVLGLWDSLGIPISYQFTPYEGKIVVQSTSPVPPGDYFVHWNTTFDSDGNWMRASVGSTQHLIFVGTHVDYDLHEYGGEYEEEFTAKMQLQVTSSGEFYIRGHAQGYLTSATSNGIPFDVTRPGGQPAYNNSEFCYSMGGIDPGTYTINIEYQITDGPGSVMFGGSGSGWDVGTGDSDGDGISDWGEFEIGTNPWLQDSDGDGLQDGTEVNLRTDPCGQSRYAVLVLGANEWDGNPTDDRNLHHGSASNIDMNTQDETAHEMYRLLKNDYEYTDAMITYLSHRTTDPGVDKYYNYTNLKQAMMTLYNQVDRDDKVVFFYTGHSYENQEVLNQNIPIGDLDNWFDVISCQDLIIILDTCKAGRYFDNLSYEYIYIPWRWTGQGWEWKQVAVPWTNRLIITATDSTHSAWCDWDDYDLNPWDLGDEFAGGLMEALWVTNWGRWIMWSSWQSAHKQGSGQGSGMDFSVDELYDYLADSNSDYHINMQEAFFYGKAYDNLCPDNYYYDGSKVQWYSEYPKMWSANTEPGWGYITPTTAYLETVTPKQGYSGP